jgi:hypothetical protein
MVIFLILLEGLATLLDILMGPGAVMSTEEAYNATSAAMLACGHTEALWSLQYKWFCGGCSTEAVLAAPFFQWWGPTIFSWKWIMGCIHMVTVTAGAAIAGRTAGARPAFVFVGLMVAALGDGAPPLSTDLIETLLIYPWGGDMMELIEIAMELRVLGSGLDALVTELVSPRLKGDRLAGARSEDPLTELEIRRPVPSRPDLEGLLAIYNDDVNAVAEVLGRSHMQVMAWVRQHGLEEGGA